MRLYCNLDMMNAAIAIIVSSISPFNCIYIVINQAAMLVLARIYLRWRSNKQYQRL